MKGRKLVHRRVTPEQAAILRRAIANYRKANKFIKAWDVETERLMDTETRRLRAEDSGTLTFPR
jgi:hypothetical protein